MNNLTNEERARIFAMYMPCDIVQGDILLRTDRKLVAIGGLETDKMQWGKLSNMASISNAFVNEFKLILTPLSKITDEHAIEVAKIYDAKEEWKVPRDLVAGGRYITNAFSGDDIYFLDLKIRFLSIDGFETVESEVMLQILDRLRELGYALPYKGKSLFELGVAIEKLNY